MVDSKHHKIISFMAIFLYMMIINTNSLSPPSSTPMTRTRTTAASSIYDILEAHGLPIGLIPKGVSDFAVDPSSGRFEFHLSFPSPCDAKFETSVRYNWNVTGVIAYGQIVELDGVAAQELFLWLPVKGIRVDVPSSGLIYFDAGVVSKQFSLSFFETPRDCAFVVDRFEASDLSFLKFRKNRSGKDVQDHSGQVLRAVS